MKFHLRAVRKELSERDEQISTFHVNSAEYKENITEANDSIRKADTKYVLLVEEYKR